MPAGLAQRRLQQLLVPVQRRPPVLPGGRRTGLRGPGALYAHAVRARDRVASRRNGRAQVLVASFDAIASLDGLSDASTRTNRAPLSRRTDRRMMAVTAGRESSR